MLAAFLVTLGVIGYLNIGYWWGKTSTRIWEKEKRSRSLTSFLCFPVSHMNDSVGRETMIFPVTIANLKDQENYAKTMAFSWPTKLALNLITITCIGVYFVGKYTALPLVKLATNPRALLPKRPPKELAKWPLKELPPAEPDPNQLNLEEHQRLLEQKVAIDARLKELEARPDFKKIKALPKRF